METAIKKALEGGWEASNIVHSLMSRNQYIWGQYWKLATHQEAVAVILLDPLFWQALGKACGWSYKNIPMAFEDADPDEAFLDWTPELEWKVNWHRFIDHLAEGKDAESFFNELLK